MYLGWFGLFGSQWIGKTADSENLIIPLWLNSGMFGRRCADEYEYGLHGVNIKRAGQ